MFPAHSIVRVVTTSLENPKGSWWVLNLEIETCVKRPQPSGPPKAIFSRFEAFMYFQDAAKAKLWAEQITPNRIIDIRYCEFEGKKKQTDGTWKGFTKVRLYPDTRLTIPK